MIIDLIIFKKIEILPLIMGCLQYLRLLRALKNDQKIEMVLESA